MQPVLAIVDPVRPAPPLGAWPALIDAMLHPVWLVDAATMRVVAANGAAGDLLGIGAPALIGRDAVELSCAPEDVVFWAEAAAGLADSIESQTLMRRFGGGTAPVTRRISRVAADDGRIVYVVAAHDRSDELRVERELESAAAQLQATLESTADGILVTDLAGRIRNFNQRFAALWNVPEDLLVQRQDDAVLEWMRRSVSDPATYMRRLATIDEATMLQTSDVIRLHSGKVIERVTLPQCTRGRPIGRVYSFRDITEKLAASERIEVLSHTDALTGLPNRRLLDARIDFAMKSGQRESPQFALLFLNLDHFSHVNETLGHAQGDRVLLDVAGRIGSCMRQIDTVARLGGDEFVLLVQQADAAGAEVAARRIGDALQPPFCEGGIRFTVTASIGISLYPSDVSSAEELVRRAEAAMRDAKNAGRAGLRFHQARVGRTLATSRSRMKLDHAMRQALAQGQFRLHYQPQVDMRDGSVVGAEALLRWHDPELGDVSPGEFIPVAEESGFIVAIGAWVLRQAVKQAATWRADGLTMPVSVNVSALQFQQPGFADGVAMTLAEFGLPASLLELELTESILIHDAEEALLRLQQLAALGIRLSIDDFGTGYSSLGYLKRLPIAALKIDRSFVSGLPTDESGAGIVRAILHMGRALRLKVVAEGVETAAQRDFLEASGCDLFQGFLFAPALDAPAFEARVATHLTPGPAASAVPEGELPEPDSRHLLSA